MESYENVKVCGISFTPNIGHIITYDSKLICKPYLTVKINKKYIFYYSFIAFRVLKNKQIKMVLFGIC